MTIRLKFADQASLRSFFSAQEDQPCLLLFNEFRQDEGSKTGENRCKRQMILTKKWRALWCDHCRCSVLALIALSTTTFGCNPMGTCELVELVDSGLVVYGGLVRLSVSPCNRGNLGIDRRLKNRLHGQNICKCLGFSGCWSITS